MRPWSPPTGPSLIREAVRRRGSNPAGCLQAGAVRRRLPCDRTKDRGGALKAAIPQACERGLDLPSADIGPVRLGRTLRPLLAFIRRESDRPALTTGTLSRRW